MPSYAKIFTRIMQRALTQADLDLRAFVEEAIGSGMSPKAIERRLMADLQDGGPIFGRFIQSLEGAAVKSTIAASNQGKYAAMAVERGLASPQDVESLIERGDSEGLERLEDETQDRMRQTSIAELIDTCDVCLPLHGKTMTHAEWREEGLLPEQRHEGWTSSCHCILVDEKDGARDDLKTPLVRNKLEGLKGRPKNVRATVRSIASNDSERAQIAVDKASRSIKGRRLLRLLGKRNATKE